MKNNAPNILFNKEKGILLMSGRSFPEYPQLVYEPIIDELKNVNHDKLSITFEFEYLNTSSSKCVLELLKAAKNTFKHVYVTWISEFDDEDMIDLGEYLHETTELHFEFRTCVQH